MSIYFLSRVMINNSGTSLNAAAGDILMNNSFSQQSETRRMNEKSSDNIEGAKGNLPVQGNADQIHTSNFYQQTQQLNQPESHPVSSGGFSNSTSIPMSAQSFQMQYNPHNQQGMNHGSMVANHSYPHMQNMHSHSLGNNDAFMHMPQGAPMAQQYMSHPSQPQNGGNQNGVTNGLSNSLPQHGSHIQQVPHSQNFNHMQSQVQLQSQQEPMMGSHIQGSGQGQQIPQPQYSLMHRGYMNQSLHGMQPQPHGSHVNLPMGSTVPSQSTMYPLQTQGSSMYPQTSQMMMNHPSAMHSQSVSVNQVPSSSAAPAGLPSRSQPPKLWHSQEHQHERSSISETIVNLLRSRRPNAAENWTEKLPQMAKKLEDALYHEAESFEEYRDRNTLKNRLQKLAIQMGNVRSGSARNPSVPVSSSMPMPQQGPMANRLPNGQQAVPQGSQTQPGSTLSSSVVNPSMAIPAHSNQFSGGSQYPNQTQMVGNNNYLQQSAFGGQNRMPNAGHSGQPAYSHVPNNMMHNPAQALPMQNQSAGHNYHPNVGGMDYGRSMGMQSQSMPPSSGTYAVNTDMSQGPSYGGSMNSMPHGMMVTPQQVSSGSVFPSIDGNPTMMPPNVPGAPYMYHVGSNGGAPTANPMMQMNTVQKKPVSSTAPALPVSQPGQIPMMVGVGTNAGSGAPPANSEEHRKQVLKQQQQRLLLLRHASKCPHENNRCPVTPHCWGMKQLWKHIMSCKDQDCKVPHCVSSRYVLSHYSKCKEPQCPVCGPVRDAIKKNYERSKEVVGIVANPAGNRAPAPPAPAAEGKTNHPPPTQEEPAKKKRKTNSEQAVKNTTLVIRPAPAPAPAPAPTPPRKVYPLDPISSAIYTFDVHQIESHIKSIQEGLRVKVSKIKEICKPLIDELYKIQYVQDIFGAPVDYVNLGLMDYPDKIKCAMDLGTVSKKLDAGSYRDFDQMAADVRLTFDNAMVYNPVGSEIHRIAKNARKEFNDKFNKKMADFDKKIAEDRQNMDACTICGEVKLEFAPPVLYCSGTCARAIKRGSWYYTNKANTYFWCPPCFNSIKPSEPIPLPDCTITKAELESNRKQHSEVHPESWVECDGGCGRWVHQICSLFNSRRNVQDLPFVCPICVKAKKVTEPNNANIVMPVTKPMKACDLPRTVLSDFLEKRIQKRLEIAYEETAAVQNTSIDKVEKCPTLTLRQVSCIDKDQDVRDGFLTRYKDKQYPTSFPCRVKCLVLFQNIDGQDVILFGMYVYEYGHNCPEPNQRRVYVSYLDSVHYLRPKQYRTLVYHEILVSYLDYVKARGFHTAHIWACPPQKGDDYILHIHPADQKTPRPQTLRIWYEQMLKRCVERGIVVEMTDLHTEFLTEANNDATLLPYFEGDYWVNEAEVIIKNLTEGKKGGSSSSIDDNAGQAKRKSKAKRAEGKDVVTGTSSKNERDPLLAKLSGIIEPMKDTFFVARLHPKEFAESFKSQVVVSPQDEAASSGDLKGQSDVLSRDDVVMPAIPDESKDKLDQAEAKESDDFKSPEEIQVSEPAIEAMNVDEPVVPQASELPSSDADTSAASKVDESVIESKDETQSSSTAAAAEPEPTSSEAPNVETDAAVVSNVKRLIMCGEDMPVLPDNTEDVDEPQQNEHFETRQSFLNLCQGNHYQFDQLRRAKHSSMMVLYHLHNPDAPKFVPTCSHCKENILQQAYHCRSCEIDFCPACVAQHGPRIHNHPLQQVGSAPQIVTEEQRKERERSIKLHMQLLSHAANCGGCESKNCGRMKEFLKHEDGCEKKAAGGCRICSRMSNLLHLHARQCKAESCKVPHCVELREQFRKLQMSQMQMDDRRRQQMNLEYNRGTQKSRGDDDDD